MNEEKKDNSFYDLEKMKSFKEAFTNRGQARDTKKEKDAQKKKSVYDSMDEQNVDKNYRKPW